MDIKKVTAAAAERAEARIAIRINQSAWNEFKRVCYAQNLRPSSVLRAMIEDFTETAKRGGE